MIGRRETKSDHAAHIHWHTPPQCSGMATWHTRTRGTKPAWAGLGPALGQLGRALGGPWAGLGRASGQLVRRTKPQSQRKEFKLKVGFIFFRVQVLPGPLLLLQYKQNGHYHYHDFHYCRHYHCRSCQVRSGQYVARPESASGTVRVTLRASTGLTLT